MEIAIGELNNKMDLMMVQIHDLTKSMSFLSSKYDEFKLHIKRVIDNQDVLNDSIRKIQKADKEQNVVISDLKGKIEQLERASLEATLNLNPLLQVNNQDLQQTVIKIGEKLGITSTKEDLLTIFRRPKRKNGNPGDVVVKFKSNEKRNNFLNKIKKAKLMHSDIGFNCEFGRIYGQEELTKEGKNIYFSALRKKKDLGWKYLWIKNGRSYVRKEEKGQTFRLDSMVELDKIV